MPSRYNAGDYPYAYQGQEKDTETGMEAFELRLWDARLGRWLTTDPVGQYHSPYLGMGNNPISQIDPDGGMYCPDPPCNQGESETFNFLSGQLETDLSDGYTLGSIDFGTIQGNGKYTPLVQNLVNFIVDEIQREDNFAKTGEYETIIRVVPNNLINDPNRERTFWEIFEEVGTFGSITFDEKFNVIDTQQSNGVIAGDYGFAYTSGSQFNESDYDTDAQKSGPGFMDETFKAFNSHIEFSLGSASNKKIVGVIMFTTHKAKHQFISQLKINARQ